MIFMKKVIMNGQAGIGVNFEQVIEIFQIGRNKKIQEEQLFWKC